MGTAVINERSARLQQGEGRCLLAASMGYQEAYGLLEKDHSLFTYYLLEGIKGANGESVDADGNVTPDSLGKYVYKSIVNLPPEKRPKQTPIRKMEAAGDIILAEHPGLGRRMTGVFQEQLSKLLQEGKVKEFNDLRKQNSALPVDLSRTQLHGAHLARIDLGGTNLYRADLSKADLERANLNGAKLDKADLEGASLRGANLTKATLRDANLTKASLENARLFQTDFQEAKLINADLRHASLANANFTNADRTGAIVEDAVIPVPHVGDADRRPGASKLKILIPIIAAAGAAALILSVLLLGPTPSQFSGDSAKPNVSIIFPTSNSTASGTVNVTAAASDDIGVTNLDFFIDRSRIGTADSPPYTILWDSTSIPNGEHTLEVVAYDEDGNEKWTSVNFTINN